VDAVIQVHAAVVFEGAGDRGGEAQGTTTWEFAGVTRIRAMEEMAVRMTMMMMYDAIEVVFHCSRCCSGLENSGRGQSGGGEVSLSLSSGIGSDCCQKRRLKRHLFPGPVDARAEGDD